MPDEIPAETCSRIRQACVDRRISMAAVSGTFNVIHPDTRQRAEGMRRLDVLASACASLGTCIITLSTGTRDPENMWKRHAENASAEAWNDLISSMEQAVEIAERWNVVLAFEPEFSNVVDTARKARQLLDEVRSPRLWVVLDGANLFHAGDLSRMHSILDEAVDLLGDVIVLAHAKDLAQDGDAGHEAAGMGLLDYDHYLGSLLRIGYSGPLILHSLSEQQVPGSLVFLQRKIDAALRASGAPAE